MDLQIIVETNYDPLSGYLLLGHKLMNQSLNTKIHPNWNFGPYKRNCKKVIQMTKLFIKEWGNKKVNVVIKKNSKFHESKLLSLNITKAKKELNLSHIYQIDFYKFYQIYFYNLFRDYLVLPFLLKLFEFFCLISFL